MVIAYQVLFNTNNFLMVIWFQVFLSNNNHVQIDQFDGGRWYPNRYYHSWVTVDQGVMATKKLKKKERI